MAKKKKPAANPARGFATTSIASKPKVEAQIEPAEITIATPEAKKAETVTIDATISKGADADPQERELHELSPEELTEQLERNELQLLVDTLGPKVRRDLSRLEAKLRTDGRVIRTQAQHISLRKWLPNELMDEILDTMRREREDAGQVARQQSQFKPSSEEELIHRCWSLSEALVNFGFEPEKVRSAMAEMLRTAPSADPGSYLWGFKESLEYLCMQTEEKNLPSYDHRKGKTSAAVVPVSVNDVHAANGNTMQIAIPQQTSRFADNSAQDSDEDAQEDVDISDFDGDVEPSDLVDTYLAMKERLYLHRPDVVDTGQLKGKKGKKSAVSKEKRPLLPNARNLQSMIRRIDSDMLFDKFEADERWAIRRIQLAQEAASARLDDSNIANGKTKEDISSPDQRDSDNPSGMQTPPSEGGSILGEMFLSAGDEVTPAPSTDTGSRVNVTLRDFGKLSGLSPRRVLEDTCRGRDGKVSVAFKLVSSSTYVSRHAVSIKWAVDQERIATEAVPYIELLQDTSPKGPDYSTSMTFSMTEIATPDSKQSEAFIATVALFYICSNSQKDDKQYMKLPPNFRDLYLELAAHRKQHKDSADRDALKIIRDMVHEHSQQQEEDGIVLAAAFRNRGLNSPRPGSSRGVSPSRAVPKGPALERIQLWQNIQSSYNYQQMLVSRMTLPMFNFKSVALSAIQQSQVIILCGETGCGKSTQLPSYVLEHELSHGRDCKIYCTQPRRISAISLAQRVSEELGESPGDVGTPRSLVGYAIRLESKISMRTRLVYATVGVVLRMLESSKALDDITHLILDEVHERSIDTDFLLIVLRSLMVRRPELKVILMSATVDASRFSRYLNHAPVINVPGRTFSVETHFLEDAIEYTKFTNASAKDFKAVEEDMDGDVEGGTSGIPKQLQGYSAETRNALAHYDEYRIDFELIVRLMEQIATDPSYANYSKATLVFLPGIAEIRELNDLLTSSPVFQHRCWVIPLHSTIASEEQQLAFKIPPPGVRKVVLATNIAETGITIPDCTCVIDTGKHKEMRYDERRQLSRLIQSFISKANAKQRRGRAGRVQEGLCFHLFTKYRHDELMAEQQTPEMLRLSLQDLIMRVKICGLGEIEDTLAQALDPPLAKNVRRAIDSLIEVGALSTAESLTTLGSQLSKLPLDANLGKLCLLSAIFGCLDVGITISAILSSKSPFVTPFGDRERADKARLSFAKGNSDLLTAYYAYTSWRRICQTPNQSAHGFCRKNYLSHQNLSNIEDLKAQLLSSMSETGLVSLDRRSQHLRQKSHQHFVQVPIELDVNSANEIIVTSVIAWSFYPKLLVRDGKGYRNIANSQQVSLHPASVNKSNHSINFLSYYSMMASSGAKHYNALSTTAVLDLPLLLMVGDADWKLHAGVVVIDGNRLRFRVDKWKDALVLKTMRVKLEELVESRLKDSKKDISLRMRKWLEFWETICKTYAEKIKP